MSKVSRTLEIVSAFGTLTPRALRADGWHPNPAALSERLS